MRFVCNTEYNLDLICLYVKAMKKEPHKKTEEQLYTFLYCAAAVALLLTFLHFWIEFSSGFQMGFLFVAILGIGFSVFQNVSYKSVSRRLKKQIMEGEENITTFFDEEGYVAVSDAVKSEYKYSSVDSVIEIPECFVFIVRGQIKIFEKRNLQGGTVDEFRSFLENVTGKEIRFIE